MIGCQLAVNATLAPLERILRRGPYTVILRWDQDSDVAKDAVLVGGSEGGPHVVLCVIAVHLVVWSATTFAHAHKNPLRDEVTSTRRVLRGTKRLPARASNGQ